MAQYNGYVSVPHGSYNEWRAATLGNGYNVDYSYGNQCWDYCALLYWQYGLTLYTKAGGGTAADCWNYSRNANSRDPFISLTGVTNIKRGDIIVFDGDWQNPAGHICFADEDYKVGGINTVEQNGYNPSAPVVIGHTSLNGFLGIFRNTKWTESPEPTPTGSTKKKKFPWPIAWHHWQNFKH